MRNRIVSALLVIVMGVSLVIPAAATTPLLGNGPVLLDRYQAEHYEMAAYREDDMFYVITVLDDGSIELAFAEKEQSARSLWLTQQDVMPITHLAVDNLDFVRSVIDYGMQHQSQSEVVKVEFRPALESQMSVTSSIQTMGVGTDGYNTLMNQLQAIHGPERYDYNWTGIAYHIVGNLTYNYKENLTLSMRYNDSFKFNMGTSLGSIVASILARITGVGLLSIIADVLGVIALGSTILDHSGAIASYNGGAVYSRYVMVQGGGPYYQCSKSTAYRGWVEEGNYGSAKLEDLGTYYSATQEIFESYDKQRNMAYANYT